MVPFAGKDDSYEVPFSTAFKRIGSRPGHKQRRAYIAFLSGFDTQQLAARYSVKESTMERWLTLERCRRRNLPNPYEVE